jgi:hypothetical protein
MKQSINDRIPSFFIPFYGTSISSNDCIRERDLERAEMPLFSNLFLPAEKCLSFILGFSDIEHAIISAPS